MKSIRSAVTCSPGTRYAPETDTLWLALSNATVSCFTTATTVTVSMQAIGSVLKLQSFCKRNWKNL